MRISLLKKLKMSGLPDSVINILFIILFICTVSPFFSGADFGIFKVPQLPYPEYLSVIGLVILGLLFIPIFSSSQCSKIIQDLVQDLNRLKFELSDFDKKEMVNSTQENKKHKGLQQNPYLIYVEPVSKKFLNNPQFNMCLPKDVRKEIEMLAYSPSYAVKDALIQIDKILNHKKMKK